MSVTVRPAGLDDATTLAQLLNAFDGTHTTPGQLITRMHACAPFLTTWLGSVDGDVAGFACLRLLPHLQADAPGAELTDLYVAPPFRRRGVARALLAQVLASAEAAGAHEIVLTTDFTNVAAQAAYREAGYVNHGLVMRKSFTDSRRPGPSRRED